MSSIPRRTCAAVAAPLVALPLAAVTTLLAAPSAAAVSTTVVVSEVYGGGGNSGAPFKNDFIELGNRSAAAVNLAGWKVQYFSAAGGSGGVTTLSGSIPAGKTFLIQQGAGSGTGENLPTPDASGSLNMSATNGRVDLLNAAGDLVDRVGFGTANAFETKATPALSNSTSASRNATFVDSDDNSLDFTIGAPSPTPSGGGGTDPDPEVVSATIAEIQGTGGASPLVGKDVKTRGVVTAVYPTGGFNGFYLQTPGTGGAADATPGASDGIFVFGKTNVAVGDCLDVAGEAAEYFGLTQLSGATLTPATGCAPVAETPLATIPVTDAEKEQYEGMLVRPQGGYTITNNYQLNQFGQVGLAIGDEPLYTATDIVAPGAAAAAYEAANKKKYITLDDGSSWNLMTNQTAQDTPLPYLSQSEPIRTGSQVSFTKPVILDYRFQWNYQPTGHIVGATDEQDPLQTENDREATPPSVGGDLRLATFNVLNYFTDLGETEDQYKNCDYFADRDGTPVATDFCEVRGAWTQAAFKDQEAKVVSAINGLDADVVSLEEIETSSQITYLPGQPRDKALATLVRALNAKGGTWSYVQSPPAVPDSEDVIRTAFIYNRNTVQLNGKSFILIDGAFANARYPVAQFFKGKKSGSPFLVVANHFKSKGSGEDDGTGQGYSNPSRIAQAKALTKWTNTIFGDEAVFLVGDFNAYSMEDPVRTIEEAGYTNLAKKFEPKSASYQFEGRLGSLDHAFANAKALKMVSGAGVWDINGDESVAMQYSRRNYNITDFFTTQPYASSDHDPLVIGLKVKGRGPK